MVPVNYCLDKERAFELDCVLAAWTGKHFEFFVADLSMVLVETWWLKHLGCIYHLFALLGFMKP